jgi:prophage maintenance system killer protein/prophage antirepressor-like protein
MKNQLVHFIDGEFEIDVNLNEETVWLTQQQICELFERERTVITKHINNIFREGELDKISNVQKMHFANSAKPVSIYNLDIVISIGYRVKSKRGTKFRRWANKILKAYLIDGYAINISRLKKENESLKELQKIISLVHKVALENDKDGSEIKNLLMVIKDYEYALDLLDQYDHGALTLDGVTDTEVKKVTVNEIHKIINEMRTNFSTNLFGVERESSLLYSIENVYQTAFGEDVYPSLEEKASNILYFLVKDHIFIDGNKRIAVAVFVYFMKKNGLYLDSNGLKRISDETLVSITLLIAESNPRDKEIIIKLIVNLISN